MTSVTEIKMQKSISQYSRHWKPSNITKDSRSLTAQSSGFCFILKLVPLGLGELLGNPHHSALQLP